MSDDKWIVPNEYIDAHERIAELLIERDELRAELAAERYALRSELAAANDMKRRMTDACEEANRVAEQYRAELAAATARLENALNEGAKRRAERDALRALLREARPYVSHHGSERTNDLLARIEAALNKEGE